MFFKRITDVSDSTYHEGIKLYRISFPDHEQREASSQTQILQDDEYHFNAIYDEDIFVGLILYWENDRFIYIEHFCILPDMQKQTIWTENLSAFEGAEQNIDP